MERFFSKKSVAVILTTIILFVFFSLTNNTYALSGNTSMNSTINPSTWRGCPVTSSVNSSGSESAKMSNAQRDQYLIICSAKTAGETKLSDSELSRMAALDQVYAQAQAASTAQTTQASRGVFAQLWDGVTDVLKSGPIGIAGAVIAGVAELIIIPLASLCVAIAGSLLDFSIHYSIYGSGFSMMNDVIKQVWVLMRDTMNISFIFILLYSGIKQIVTGSIKKDIIVSVIITAVLINFSLFITKIVIDGSNIVATAIYKQIDSNFETSGNAARVQLANLSGDITTSPIDLSGKLMAGLGLTTMFDTSGAGNDTTAKSLVGVAGIINSFVRLVLFFITFYMFLMLAAIVAGRFVMLVVLMATSPLGFVGELVPALGGGASWWRKNLGDQVMVAPMLMFFMLLTLKLAKALKGTNAAPLSMQFFFNYFFIIYMLKISIDQVKKLSGDVAKMADKFASTATGLGLAAVTGGTAALARGSLGAAATSAAGSKWAQRLETASAAGGIKGSLAKMTLSGVKGTASSTFDMRNTDTFKETSGQLKGMGLVNLDKKFEETSGKYGKNGTGYSGQVAQRTQDAIAEAKGAEKSQKEFEQKFVDMNPEMLARFQEKQTAKFATEKAELDADLKKAQDANDKDSIDKIQKRIETFDKKKSEAPKAADVIKAHQKDLEEADEKVKEYQTLQAKLKVEEQKVNDALTKGNMSADEFTKTQAAAADLKKQQQDLESTYRNAQKIVGTVNKEELAATVEVIKEAKERRNIIADRFRQKGFFTSGRTEATNTEIGSKVLRDREKEPELKDLLKKQESLEEKIDKK